MSLYLDTSVLLKVFFNEPESAKTAVLIGREPHITVSSLARLEALVQIQRHVAAALVRAEMADRLRQQIEIRLQLAPFELRKCPATLIETAEKQIASPTTYCP
ncbi:MAG: type II toxin-antitoxin system VapC family toxin, partial [Verrucomicrobia bacterium]|nr:type II toxin-antitoxin system VapC family toxin [Verrucomicrobiota bacterium]